MFRLFVLLCLCVMPALAGARAETDRFAIVIGNKSYEWMNNNEPVPNSRFNLWTPENDARAYTDVVERLGWTVLNDNRIDLSAATLHRVLDDAASSITQGSEVVFIYNGHGFSENQENYLVGINEIGDRYRDINEMRTGSIRVAEVVKRLSLSAPSRIVLIINACSDEPLIPSISLSPQRPVFEDTNAEILILYSSSPRGVAYDVLDTMERADPEVLSVFSRVFVDELERDVPLLEAFTRTRIEVEKLSNYADTPQSGGGRFSLQIPHVLYDSINGAFSMNRPLTVGAEEFSDADWRIAAVACRSNPDALAEALSLRATEGWRDQEERTAVLNCITEAAAARFGIQKYSFAPDEGGQIQITLGSGQGTFQSGDIVKRLMVFDDQGARREVIRLSSVEAFQSALSNYAFRDGWTFSIYTYRDQWSFQKVEF